MAMIPHRDVENADVSQETLGTIVQPVKAAVEGKTFCYWRSICQPYDMKYATRPDYRLWVLFCRPSAGDSEISARWRSEEKELVLAQGCLTDPNPLVRWGAISLLSRPLTQTKTRVKEWAANDRDDLVHVLDACHAAVAGSCDSCKEQPPEPCDTCALAVTGTCLPLDGHEAECGALAALLADAVQKTRYDVTHCPLTLREANAHLGRIKQYIRHADPSWQMGRSFSSSALKTSRVLVGALPVREISDSLKHVAFHAREAILRSLRELDRITPELKPVFDHLVEQALMFARSAWLQGRSARFSLPEFWQRPPFLVQANVNVPLLWSEELMAEWKFTQALRDCGAYEENAHRCARLLYHIPDWVRTVNGPGDLFCDWAEDLPERTKIHARSMWKKVEELQRLGDNLGHTIRQAGLDVAEDFRVDEEENKARIQRRFGEDPISTNREGGPRTVAQQSDVPGESGTEIDPFYLRVRYDQEYDEAKGPLWEPVLRACPARSSDRDALEPLGRLWFEVHRGEHQDDDVLLRAAFKLSRGRGGYYRLRWAADFLDAIGPDRELLLDFVHDVKRASQSMPLGECEGTRDEWLRLIRAHLRQLLSRDAGAFSRDELLTIHEVLVGRRAAITRAAGGVEACAIVLREFGRLDNDELCSYLDETSVHPSRGLATVDLSTIRKWLTSEFRDGRLGVPVCCSVVCHDNDTASILTISGDDALYKAPCDRPQDLSGLDECLVELRKDCALLARHGWEIPWTLPKYRPLVGLARSLLNKAIMRQPSCRWIMLAADPRLVGVPWQDLIAFVAGDLERIVVSLVPNLSWAVWDAVAPWRPLGPATASPGRKRSTTGESEADHIRDVKLLLDEGDPVLGDICDQLESDRPKIERALGSACIAVGHGAWMALGGESQEKIPSVRVKGKTLSLTDWWEYGRRSVAILGVCWGGDAANVFLGDMGGLPGVLLRRTCRVLLAPIAEVPPDAIKALITHVLAEGEEKDEAIGARYLGAINDEPSVALYNLYGFADREVLGVSADSASNSKRGFRS